MSFSQRSDVQGVSTGVVIELAAMRDVQHRGGMLPTTLVGAARRVEKRLAVRLHPAGSAVKMEHVSIVIVEPADVRRLRMAGADLSALPAPVADVAQRYGGISLIVSASQRCSMVATVWRIVMAPGCAHVSRTSRARRGGLGMRVAVVALLTNC
jgi:hypothetical protein